MNKQHTHPDPNQDSGKEQKRKISGELHVRGEVIVDSPPEEKKADAAEKKKKHARENLKIGIEGATLFFVLIYAGLTALLVCFASKSLKSTERFAALEQRPYVHSLGEPSIIPSIKNAGIMIKNFGKSPAVRLLRAAQVIGVSDLDDVSKQSDDWFNKMGKPLRAEYDSKSGMYKLQNGISISEDTIMQDGTTILGGDPLNITSIQTAAIFVGRIQYYDLVGNFYWTDFCYIIATQANSTAPFTYRCFKHNEIH